MTIEELSRIAEKEYAGDKTAKNKNGALWLLDFHIDAMEALKKAGRIHYVDETLSDLEILSIVILEGFGSSQLIQEPIYNPSKSNKLTQILSNNLDSALKKAPACTHNILYANDGFERSENKVGDRFTVKGYLTSSKDDFDNAHTIKWVITPLPLAQTKAHEIYKIYNHGDNCPYPEYQVEFERNTSFVITKILYGEGENFDTIYIEEVKD